MALAGVTGVLGDERYNQQRVVITWAMAAPLAAFFRLEIFAGFPLTNLTFILTDAASTLVLMLALRIAEKRGYL